VIPDRIETGTFIAACAIAGGDIEIRACEPQHLRAVVEKFREAGVRIEEGPENLRVRSPRVLRATSVSSLPYPGFPTDMQAQYMALMTQATGTSTFSETIFENRYMHVQELARGPTSGWRAARGGNRTTPLSGAQLANHGPPRLACLVSPASRAKRSWTASTTSTAATTASTRSCAASAPTSRG
jgi:UDP-N-acetylglucosamine 1-carboxyvinyltransferase